MKTLKHLIETYRILKNAQTGFVLRMIGVLTTLHFINTGRPPVIAIRTATDSIMRWQPQQTARINNQTARTALKTKAKIAYRRWRNWQITPNTHKSNAFIR